MEWSYTGSLAPGVRQRANKKVENSRLRVGKNKMVKRLNVINNMIGYDWPNVSYETYKVDAKNCYYVEATQFCFIYKQSPMFFIAK